MCHSKDSHTYLIINNLGLFFDLLRTFAAELLFKVVSLRFKSSNLKRVIMINKTTQLVRFDWAIKHILRDKANFVVLEGFLSVLLKE
jgi:hypothetical protein